MNANRTNISTLSLLLLAAVMLVAGCGGGGSSDTASATGAATQNTAPAQGVVSRTIGQGDIGPSGATLSGDGFTFSATLSATRTVTVSQRFYTYGRPGGLIGQVIDIQPDGLDFSASPATLCLSYAGAGLDGANLSIYTGSGFSQELPTSDDRSNSRVCASLTHTSPYSIRLAQNLAVPEFTIFGNLDTKSKYYYKTETTNGTDPDLGSWVQYRIHVECNARCMEEGDRFFKFIRGGDHDGDLYLRENGTYPLWRDYGNMQWAHIYNSGGGLEGGIGYLLAAQFVKYFIGDGQMETYISALDPAENAVQSFSDANPTNDTYDVYIAMTLASGIVTLITRNDGTPERTFTIEKATGKITRSRAVSGVMQTSSATPAETGYTALRDEALIYINRLLGLDDAPDETAGDPYDLYKRMTPNQELFVINVRNLITGLGWNSLEAIEGYYRDRLNTMPPGLQ